MTYAALIIIVAALSWMLFSAKVALAESNERCADLRTRLDARDAELKEAVILVAMAGAEVARERGRGELTVGYGAFWD